MAGGSGGMRGFRSGESTSSMERGIRGGVTVPVCDTPFVDIFGREFLKVSMIGKRGGDGSDGSLCCTTKTDLFWWGNMDTAIASETSAVVPAVSYEACDKGVA